MIKTNRWQDNTINQFLLVSRAHLGLERRQRRAWSQLHRLRRGILRSMLVIGGIGGLFGGTAYADASDRGTEARTEKTAPNRPLGSNEKSSGSAIERMP
ncbi:MAG: hypothetical protein D3M94_00185 [Rhodocyclales bacterium GT-UBC]|nr:MAG: hypothetical protein D3M94_00185 [Rhodocyclales bacterium GT-UBC]